jgi:hypothetical protein
MSEAAIHEVLTPCRSVLKLPEEEYNCGHWDDHEDEFHEALFPNFIIQWNDEGRWIHMYRGILR